MVFGSDGLIAIVVTAMFARKSLSGNQEAPPFVVFQMPPATAAAYITLGLVGSMTSARVRPPTLPGPSACQVPSTPLVEALPSPAPPPPVPFGNSPSSPGSTGPASPACACGGIILFLAVEKRFIFLIFSLASK